MVKISRKSIIQFVIMLGIGVLIIWLIFLQVEPKKQEIIQSFKQADYFWIIFSMLIGFLSHFLRAYRWNYLLMPLGHKTKLANAVCHVMVGYFANYGIPRSGEVTRCTLASRYDKVPFEVGFGTVITERIVDTLLFVLIFVLTLVFQFDRLIGLANELIFDKLGEKFSSGSATLFFVLALFFISLLLFFVFRKKIKNLLKGKIGGKVSGMLNGISSIRKLEKPVEFIVLSLLIWASYFYSLYVCFFAISGTAHLGQKECLTLLLFGTFGVIFTPGGIGAYPAILYGILFKIFEVEESSAVAMPWLSWGGQFVMIVLLGIISLFLLPVINKSNVSPTAEK